MAALPRNDEVRRELVDIGITYLLVLGTIAVGALIYVVSRSADAGVSAHSVVPAVGPF